MSEKKNVFRERVFPILTIICSVCIIIVAVLKLFGIWKDSMSVAGTLISTVLLLQTYGHWENNRSVAIFSLCAAIFMIICTAVILLIK